MGNKIFENTLADEVRTFSALKSKRKSNETIEQCIDEIIEFINADKSLGLFQTSFGISNPFYDIIQRSGLMHSFEMVSKYFPDNTFINGGNILIRYRKFDKKGCLPKQVASYYYDNYILERIYETAYEGNREIKFKRDGNKWLNDKYRPFILKLLERDGFKYDYKDSTTSSRYHTLTISW